MPLDKVMAQATDTPNISLSILLLRSTALIRIILSNNRESHHHRLMDNNTGHLHRKRTPHHRVYTTRIPSSISHNSTNNNSNSNIKLHLPWASRTTGLEAEDPAPVVIAVHPLLTNHTMPADNQDPVDHHLPIPYLFNHRIRLTSLIITSPRVDIRAGHPSLVRALDKVTDHINLSISPTTHQASNKTLHSNSSSNRSLRLHNIHILNSNSRSFRRRSSFHLPNTTVIKVDPVLQIIKHPHPDPCRWPWLPININHRQCRLHLLRDHTTVQVTDNLSTPTPTSELELVEPPDM